MKGPTQSEEQGQQQQPWALPSTQSAHTHRQVVEEGWGLQGVVQRRYQSPNCLGFPRLAAAFRVAN